MPDKTGVKDLQMVLAKLKEEWRELADLLASQSRAQDRVIEVEKILLRDGSGQYRGKISANPDGSADLLLSDRSGKAWVRLGVNRNGEACLELKDREGESSFKVGIGAPSAEARAGLVATPGEAAHSAASQPVESPDVSPRLIRPAASEGEASGESGPGLSPPGPGPGLYLGGDTDTGVVERLEELGRQNRRQKFYWALVLVVLGVILATQAYVLFRPHPAGWGGEALVVRDANGKMRASLGAKTAKSGWTCGTRKATGGPPWGWGPRGLPIWPSMTGPSGSGPS